MADVVILGEPRPTGIKLGGQAAQSDPWAVLLDVLLRERSEFPCAVTRYPVENGADMADHIRLESVELEIEGMISGTPIALMDGQWSARIEQQNPNQTVLLPQSWNVSLSRSPSDIAREADLKRPGDAMQKLLDLRNNREVLTIISSLMVFKNMALNNLDFPRDEGTGQALFFRARFTQIQSAQLQTVPLPATDIYNMAAPSQNVGRQSTLPVGE